ncbi:MAG: hypothetical protein ABIH84_00920 [bacterium]
MNNKKLIPLILGLVVVVIVAGAIFLSGKSGKKAPSEMPVPSPTAGAQSEETTGSGNIFDMLSLNQDVKCTYNSSEEGAELSGTSYISGQSARADFSTTDPEGQTIDSHMISDGEWVYVWTSASATGYKMPLIQAQEDSMTVSNEDSAPISTVNNNFDYACTPWAADSSFFAVPENINFTDLATPASGCATCELLEDAEGIAACKAQLGCP